MNPDVLVLDNGTIEGMIEQIETKDHIVGGQPLVWNCYYGDDAALQQNIRVVPTYMDLCMLSFEPLKILMRSRYKRMIYQNRMPFNEEIEYRVPSGAFFLIKANIFDEMGKFDEETFLYYEEHIIGNAEVRQTFKISNVGTIAGAYVLDGKLERNAGVRVLRDNVVIHDGKLASLKRFKDDAKEVTKGYECGIQIEKYNDIKEGDIIEAYILEEIKR